MSGRDDSTFRCSRNRKPSLCRKLRITRSGFVSLLRMPDIIRERVNESTVSTNAFTSLRTWNQGEIFSHHLIFRRKSLYKQTAFR